MKVYIIVRQDLPPVHQSVQAAHAVAELCTQFDVQTWAKDHKTLVMLGVSSEEKLLDAFDKIKNLKKALFKEPDLNNQSTALAFVLEEPESWVKKLKLVKY